MMKVLFLTRECPLDVRSGGMIYALGILKHLDRIGWDVEIHWLNPIGARHAAVMPDTVPGTRIRIGAPSTIRIGHRRVNPRRIVSAPIRKFASLLQGRFRIVSNVLMRKAMNFAHPSVPLDAASPLEADPTSGEVIYCRKVIDSFRPDLAILNYICLTPLLDKISWPGSCRRAVLAHDLWHLRAENLRQAGLQPDIKEWTFEEERERYKAAGKVIGISCDERPVFLQMLGEDKVLTIPKAVEWNEDVSREVPGRCLFVGTAMGVNVDAIRWFIEDIWPAVIEGNPKATLHVCGSVCREVEGKRPGVLLRGVVDDLQSEYREAQVVVVPLRAGGGVKIKLAEALEFGKCCVSTRSGIRGMPAAENSGIAVEDDAAAFASAVLRLFGDPAFREESRGRCRQWVGQHLSPTVSHAPLIDWASPSRA